MPSSHLSVRDGRDGSRRVSAHARQQLLQVLSCPGHPASQLGHHLAEKGLSSGKQLGWVCADNPFCPCEDGIPASAASCQQHSPSQAGQTRVSTSHRFRNAPSPPVQHLPCCLLQTLPSGVVAKPSPQLIHLLLQETQQSVNGEAQGKESTRSLQCSPPATPVPEPAASATSVGQRQGDKSGTSRVVLCHWGSATGSGQALQKGQPVGTGLCKEQSPASSGCRSRSL